MRIGIDARFFGTLGKGLGRYTQKLIKNLEKLDSSNEYFIFLRKENFDEYHPENNNFRKILANYKWYTLSEQLNMPRILNKYDLDLVHFPHFNVPIFYKKPFVITIHDLILLHFPTIRGTTLNPIWYWIKFLFYKLIISSAIRRAKKIIAVSDFTKNDILKNYNVSENKISVTYESASENSDKNSVQENREILKKYGIMKPYILYVGNAYPHKNLEALVLAFGELPDTYLHLVFVGKIDYFYNRLKKMAERRRIGKIVFTNFVSDGDLEIIYRHSLFYVFPSLYEGFGLPPLEAMKNQIPVAASGIPCLREILGNNAYYFDAKKKDSIKQAIMELFKNEKLRKELSEKGSEHAKKFSWKNMAEKTLDIYINYAKK